MTPRRRHLDVIDMEFASFVEDVRAAVPSYPDEGTAQRHLAAMRAAAEGRATRIGADASGPATERNGGAGAEWGQTGRLRPAGRLRPLRLGAALAGAVVVLGGSSTVLAAAGVELPEPVRAPFEAVGIELPNQPEDVAEDGAPAGENPDPPAGGAPAPAPSGAAGDAAEETAPRDDEGERGTRRRGETNRSERARNRGRDERRGQPGAGPGRSSASGDETAPGQSQGSQGRGSRGNSAGQAIGQSKSQGKSQGQARRRSGGGPVRPAPKRSAQRGAGPARPVKPEPVQQQPDPRPKPQKQAPAPEPAPEAEPVPAPAPDEGTTTP